MFLHSQKIACNAANRINRSNQTNINTKQQMIKRSFVFTKLTAKRTADQDPRLQCCVGHALIKRCVARVSHLRQNGITERKCKVRHAKA